MTSIRANGVVEFRFYRPGVAAASVRGDFDAASDAAACDELLMCRDEAGWWTATAKLPAGEYRFRYFADGEWFPDYAAHGVEFEMKAWRSVLVVPEPNEEAMNAAARQAA
jgi:1,4-alpha-glucan branching enzyme